MPNKAVKAPCFYYSTKLEKKPSGVKPFSSTIGEGFEHSTNCSRV